MWGAYSQLGSYLAGRARAGERDVTLLFGDVEVIIGHPLPRRARRHAAWWRNTTLGVRGGYRVEGYHWYGWVSVGWEAAPDVPGGTVTFRYRRAGPS
ncbi:MAG: hypothetical protein M3Q65_25555 [Chloroflexota bacterium]|nr:hypothetical protein [Chloroflexota bacterium]